eukprot:m.93678 g.93678  ORF g.93678 m.93678 type:complete len:571 (+) comp13004_c0_seq1:62-1774(+)
MDAVKEAPTWVKVVGGVAVVGAAGAVLYYLTRPTQQVQPATNQTAAITAKTGNTTTATTTTSTASSKSTDSVPQADVVGTTATELKTLGNGHYRARKFEDAIACYTRAIAVADKEDPDIAVYYANRAAAQIAMKAFDQVVADATAALAHRPRYVKALSRRAQAYEKLKQPRQALVDYTMINFIEKFENKPAKQAVERLLETLGREAAYRHFQSRPKVLPSKTAIAQYFSDYQASSVGETETESSETIRGLIAAKPADGLLQLRLTKALINEAKYQEACDASVEAVEAISEMRLTAEVKPQLVNAMLLKGSFLMMKLDLEAALATFAAALRFEKNNANTMIRLASCKLEMGDPMNALTDFDLAEKADPKNPDVFYHRGRAKLATGAVQTAQDDLAAAVALKPTNFMPYVHLALIYFQSGNPAKGLEMMEESCKKFPESAVLHTYTAELNLLAGQLDAAERHIAQSIDIDPTYAAAYVHKGMVSIQRNQRAEGIALIHKALEVDPSCEPAYAKLVQVHIQQQEFDAAIDNCDKAIAVAHVGADVTSLFSFREACVAQRHVLGIDPSLFELLP